MMQTPHSVVMRMILQEQPQYNLFERTKVESDYVPLVSLTSMDVFEATTIM